MSSADCFPSHTFVGSNELARLANEWVVVLSSSAFLLNLFALLGM